MFRDCATILADDPATALTLFFADIRTGRYIGEGFDDSRLDTLFLALPVSWKGTLVQYTGRLHRLHPDKSEVRIYDYVDSQVPMLARMFERRQRGYRAIGYSTEEISGLQSVSCCNQKRPTFWLDTRASSIRQIPCEDSSV